MFRVESNIITFNASFSACEGKLCIVSTYSLQPVLDCQESETHSKLLDRLSHCINRTPSTYTFLESPHLEGEAKAKQKQSEGTARAKQAQNTSKAEAKHGKAKA